MTETKTYLQALSISHEVMQAYASGEPEQAREALSVLSGDDKYNILAIMTMRAYKYRQRTGTDQNERLVIDQEIERELSALVALIPDDVNLLSVLPYNR